MGMKLGWRRLAVGAVALLASPALAVLMAFPTASAGDPPVDPPVPVVSVSTTGSPLVGQSVGIDLTFVNASTANAGYGPYVDLRLPLGADGYDGLTFEGATYLGAAVTATWIRGDAESWLLLPAGVQPCALRTAAGGDSGVGAGVDRS